MLATRIHCQTLYPKHKVVHHNRHNDKHLLHKMVSQDLYIKKDLVEILLLIPCLLNLVYSPVPGRSVPMI